MIFRSVKYKFSRYEEFEPRLNKDSLYSLSFIIAEKCFVKDLSTRFNVE